MFCSSYSTQQFILLISRNLGAIIDSPTWAYSIPTTFMRSGDDSHTLLDPVEQATQRNIRLWNEEDRRNVRFESDVAGWITYFILNSERCSRTVVSHTRVIPTLLISSEDGREETSKIQVGYLLQLCLLVDQLLLL